MKTEVLEKELSYRLVGILYKIHRELGMHCRERQYGDAMERELRIQKIHFQREKNFMVAGRNSNRVDFLIEGRIIVELKAKPVLERLDFDQMKRYLHVSGIQLGLIVNFLMNHLRPRRVLKPHLLHS